MSDVKKPGLGKAASGPAARLGGELRAARQRLGWELPDLADSLRIRQAYLEAIEDGRMVDLPGTTYALGFVRAYAAALGLPGEEVSKRFRDEANEAHPKQTLSFPAPVPQRGVPAGALMLVGALILGAAYAGWYWVTEHQLTPVHTVPPIPDRLLPMVAKPAPSPQVASILPAASPPTPQPSSFPQPVLASQGAALAAKPVLPPAPAPGAALLLTPPAANAVPPPPPVGLEPAPAPAPSPPGTRIVIKVSADAWVTIKPKTGPALLNKLMHAGDVFAVPPGQTGLLLTSGNAGGTEIDVDGTPIQGLGGAGAVRRNLPLDPDLLKAGKFPVAKPKTPPKP
jgi:cytoskeleton protein RodZ